MCRECFRFEDERQEVIQQDSLFGIETAYAKYPDESRYRAPRISSIIMAMPKGRHIHVGS
jgi:hypothetical protein